MVELPESLQPEADWDYQVLVSANGVAVSNSGESWTNRAEPFVERCEGREAQVIFVQPAADGELVALTYYKWGGWNVNLRWRETIDGPPIEFSTPAIDGLPDDGPVEQGTASADSLAELAARFNRK
jgi:hypothetical protein